MCERDKVAILVLGSVTLVVVAGVTFPQVDWESVRPWLQALGPFVGVAVAIYVPWWMANRSHHKTIQSLAQTVIGLLAKAQNEFNMMKSDPENYSLGDLSDPRGECRSAARLENVLTAISAIDMTIFGNAAIVIRLLEIRDIGDDVLALIAQARSARDPREWTDENAQKLAYLGNGGLITTRELIAKLIPLC